MPRRILSAPQNSQTFEEVRTMPGAYPTRTQLPQRLSSNLRLSSSTNTDHYITHPLAQVGLGQSLKRFRRPSQAEPTLLKRAAPEHAQPSMSQYLSWSGRFVGEKLGIRNGEAIRRDKLEVVLLQMAEDFKEWTTAAKRDPTTRIFVVRCRGHLERIEKLRREHQFIRDPLNGAVSSAAIGDRNCDEEDALEADFSGTTKKLTDWIAQAVLETDICLRQDCLTRINFFRQQLGGSDKGASTSRLRALEVAMEQLTFLSDRSKSELRQTFMSLREDLRGH